LRPERDLGMRAAAEAFLNLLALEPDGPGVGAARRREVERDIERFGFYEHSPEELLWGARFAWRHSVRCVGRFFWKQLEVVDARACAGVEEMAHRCVEHLKMATNGGKIRPILTVFPAERPTGGPRVWNYELLRYAGYRGTDSKVLGDPAEVNFTALCQSLGWVPPHPPSSFDLLPWVLSFPGGKPRVFEIPREAVLEVPLEHPEFFWFGEMGLRWYAVPVVSNMALEIGGIRYSAAPFNGWYMGTEIGARNLSDRDRYDLLPEVARRMGIWEKREMSLWRDRALVEMNRAVLASFQKAGVRMVDHHTVADLHLQFEAQEQSLGRPVTGRWDWLIPPLSGATSPLWNRSYDPTEYSPNFIPQPGLPPSGG
jgi:nitric-oxide synthase